VLIPCSRFTLATILPALPTTSTTNAVAVPNGLTAGIARLLMQDLIELSARASIREMVVVIGNPLLSNASIALHRSLGFNEVGILRGVGEKFGRALDVLIMQKSLTST
jgi:L-amino acid N-acyltransferase YncA